MKMYLKSCLFFALFGFSATISAQTLSPNVSPTQGGNYVAGTVDLSWTMGETTIPTLTSGSTMLSQGFEQPEVQITVGVIASAACEGGTVNIPFTSSGYVDAANVFTAQLSDAFGSFTSPVSIGTLTSIAISGTITATIPGGTSVGSNYLIRVVGSTPVFTSKASSAFTVNPAPVFGASAVNVSCNGANDGKINITVSVGSSPFTYSINAGSSYPYSASPVTGLSPNAYNVMVQDNNSCISLSSIPVTITQPAVLSTPTATKVDVQCFGLGNGSVTCSVPTGGTSPYTYSLNGGTYQSSPIFGSLIPDNYTVTVKDANGCTSISNTVTVSQPTVLTGAAITATNVTCNSINNGTVSVSPMPSGGVPSYLYQLNGGAFSSNHVYTNLSPGNYTVTVRDANGCMFTTNTLTITQPTPLTTPTITETDVLCRGGNSGTVTVSVVSTGGTAPIQYSLNGITTYSSSTNYTGLIAGNYTILVKDGNGCTTNSNTVTINQPATALSSATATGTNVTCHGFGNGTVTLATPVTGGVSPYQYALITGVTIGSYSPTITSYSSLPPNTYNFIAKDANGCTFTTNTVTVTQPNVLTVNATNDGPYYGTTQTIHLYTAVAGGTASFSYSWSGPLSYTGTAANPAIINAIVPMTGVYHVTVTDVNGCTATDTSYVQVNSSLTYTWTGVTDTNWTTVSNWTPTPLAGGPNGCWADIYIPYVTTHQPVVSSAIAIGNLQMDAPAVLTLHANVSMCKNLKGGIGGGIQASIVGSGLLILDGSILQTLTGRIQVNELKLFNAAGAKVIPTGPVQIVNALDLAIGNMDATNGTLYLTSSAVNQCAILDNFSPGFAGTFSGNILAQRYYAASSTYNQHFMGSVVNSAAFSQFGARGTSGYVIGTPNCSESSIASNSPYSTVLALDESHGTACTSNQWIAEVAGNSVNGEGYAVSLGGSGVLTLTGAPNLNSSYSLTGLTNSNWSSSTLQGHIVTSGWHLLANPYSATLNLSTVPAGFDAQIQVWNCNGPFAGSYQPGIIGTNATLAPFQGFMVHKTVAGGTATYTLNGSDRSRTAKNFYQANDNELKIVAENLSTNLLDQTTVAFNPSATEGFDPQFDANKTAGALNRHTLYSVNNSQWMSLNVLQSIDQTSTVPVGFEPGQTGSYKFSFNGVNTFDATTYIYLEDKLLHVMYNVRNGDYNFTSDSADAWDRFVLHFTPPAVKSVTDAACNQPGKINVTQPGAANWNYTLSDANNTLVASGILNETSPLSVSEPVGSYTLRLIDNNNYTATEVLQINGTDPITAAFTTPAAIVLEGQNVVFTATTSNAVNYQWSLGNGQTATGSNLTCNYAVAGEYSVALKVTNLSGCTSTVSQTITVNAAAINPNPITDNKSIGIWSNENRVYVDFQQLDKVDAVISIFDILGREISNEKYNNNLIYQKEIDNIEAAYMIVSVKNNDMIITRKVFIVNAK